MTRTAEFIEELKRLIMGTIKVMLFERGAR
jgi:hypothetical protein